ncbi:PREDICTED: uncharacterized protein LOC104606304 [Nelumbo nucifera]|uniref:Uncharacterized protein LOC104606304 n=2 Tax=Nelumbo nucifera TaxID=4432 RepID=A0A1U8B2A0_NELNU|nr:PREDICTED: uncharacterized protein LOC104606304 [Nelumbo nucifera]XP_010269731.1 PREDICTED: uncharacterized protein LOC104606304 [Nelumbo nucifera]XP_010269732.1 PREDICTED: uncharacterized protein LOC104606304 [Nelumbo nucifera]DAD29620.1 TPA_asm: hypothetical protein HUJ06_031088 [Nelumbo nucifera]
MKLFDSHCHLQDPRVYHLAPQLIQTAQRSGVLRFAVNGITEKDWHLVKEMSEQHSSVVPCFGLHPWFVSERSPNWLNTLRDFFETTPSAAVGEIGLDKGSRGKEVNFTDQVQVFSQQLELAKELHRPASVHCVRAFGELLEIMQNAGPFPSGVILHSYLGSAEMVPGLAKLGAYFSFSGFLMSMKPQKAKRMLKSVPTERILLETDAPDALPRSNSGSVLWFEGSASDLQGPQNHGGNSTPNFGGSPNDPFQVSGDSSTVPKEALNHPANIRNVLSYVASLLEMPEEELAEVSYRNANRLFSYPGSKIPRED